MAGVDTDGNAVTAATDINLFRRCRLHDRNSGDGQHADSDNQSTHVDLLFASPGLNVQPLARFRQSNSVATRNDPALIDARPAARRAS
jgi:hypothetical protein